MAAAVEREIANELVDLIDGGSFTGTIDSVARGMLPAIRKEDFSGTDIKVTVVPVAKAGVESDREFSEWMDYDVGVAVTANVNDHRNNTATDVLSDTVQEIQDLVADADNRELSLATKGTAKLILPFVNDPILDAQLLRSEGVFLSVTVFTYAYFQTRE